MTPADNQTTEAEERPNELNTGGRISLIKKYVPGILAIGVITAASMAANFALPLLNGMVIAIILGALVANVYPAPSSWQPGITFSAKKLLRAGIVLLGLQISVQALIGLGWERILLVVVTVMIGVVATLFIGHVMGINRRMSALVASGFSICGASAVAGTKDIVTANEEETGTALALVTLLGTIMIPLLPAMAVWMNMSSEAAGTWIGAATPEVAQVVAAASNLDEAGLATAVSVKLARVVCLAGVTVGLSLWVSHSLKKEAAAREISQPPLVPGFVIGFLLMVVLTSVVPFPQEALDIVKIVQNILLTMAMAGLGFGIQFRKLIKVGARPTALAVFASLIVWGVSLAGSLLIG